jgi:Ca2+-binding RTX toxin-like protein
LNQLYSDQNQVFGAAAQTQDLGRIMNPLIIGTANDFLGGVSVTGGVSGLANAAFAGSVNFDTGNFTAAFGINYNGSTLYGYSPDPKFIQSTIIDATLNGATSGEFEATAWSLLGGLGNDSIIGDRNNDTALGGAGNDSIFGGDGNDSLLGEVGNDTIDGGLGNDSINGGLGNDSILGGAGANTIDGDAGNDTIVGRK